jgi:Macrocin-O-methyltransferase (TylF)
MNQPNNDPIPPPTEADIAFCRDEIRKAREMFAERLVQSPPQPTFLNIPPEAHYRPLFPHSILKAFNSTNRRVWVADSFAGVPHPGDGRVDDLIGYLSSAHRFCFSR